MSRRRPSQKRGGATSKDDHPKLQKLPSATMAKNQSYQALEGNTAVTLQNFNNPLKVRKENSHKVQSNSGNASHAPKLQVDFQSP